jgi:hypothetical protein
MFQWGVPMRYHGMLVGLFVTFFLAAAPGISADEAATELVKTQLKAAKQAYGAAMDTMAVEHIGGLMVLAKGNSHARPDLVYTWSVRWVQAESDLSEKKENRIAAYAAHQKRIKELRENCKKMGTLVTEVDHFAAEWYVAEADLWLLKERGK